MIDRMENYEPVRVCSLLGAFHECVSPREKKTGHLHCLCYFVVLSCVVNSFVQASQSSNTTQTQHTTTPRRPHGAACLDKIMKGNAPSDRRSRHRRPEHSTQHLLPVIREGGYRQFDPRNHPANHKGRHAIPPKARVRILRYGNFRAVSAT